MSKVLQMEITYSVLGIALPFSHNETVSCETSNISPNFACESPFSRRNSLILLPIPVDFMHYLANIHPLYSTRKIRHHLDLREILVYNFFDIVYELGAFYAKMYKMWSNISV